MDDGAYEERMIVARARQRRLLLLAFGLPLVMFPAGLVIGYAGSDGSEGPFPWLSLAIALALLVLIVALTLGLFYLAYRRGAWWLQAGPAMALPWRERRRLVKAIRAGEHRSGFEEVAARDLARRMVMQRWAIVLVPVIGLVNLVPAVLDGSTTRIVLWSAFLVAMLAACVQIGRDVGRARRFQATAVPLD